MQTLLACILEPLFRYCFSVLRYASLTEINQLPNFQNRAARIITNVSFDAPRIPLIKGLGWKTFDELISSDSKTLVFQFQNQLALRYLCDRYTRNPHWLSFGLRNTGTDLRLPMKISANGQRSFSCRGALSAESNKATSLYSLKKTI